MRKIAIQETPVSCSDLKLTKHAFMRMSQRSLSAWAVDTVLAYGRSVFVRGAEIYAVGRKEVKRYLVEGINLSPCEGIHVVCATSGEILTVYRNRDLRGLRR